MKIPLRYCYLSIVLFSLTCSFSYGQKTLEGYIFDKISKKPLSYAAIKIVGTRVYTTSNEDGKFEFLSENNIDSLEIRYLGYETTKVSINYFRSKKIFYLKPFTAVLDEVIVSSNKKNPKRTSRKSVADLKEDRLYKLLYEIIKKYRKNKKINDSKAYFTLNSKTYFLSKTKLDTVPIEQIEGFYNGKQQLSKGILNLELKTGRFGQNRLFPFYSLDYITLLESFNLFKIGQPFLPQHPGNMSLSRIKRRYNLDLQKTDSYDGTIIHFQPKRERGDIFSGKIFFQETDSIIEKIALSIRDPRSFKLNSISIDDSVLLKNVTLNISFNPIDLSKIQYYDLNLNMVYSSDTIKKNITSNVILYFYDYNTHFTKPYFTNTIEFENDYDRLLTLPVSDKIWKQNYPYPKSIKDIKTTNFFKQKNQFYSYYVNKLPSHSLKNIKISSVTWSHQKKLLTSDLKIGLGVKLNFYYVVNSYEKENGNFEFILKTLFDTKTSFFRPEITLEELDCINLAFDIYELNRYYLLNRIKKSMTLADVKTLADQAILDARVMMTLMFDESQFGSDNVSFNSWKTKIHNALKKHIKSHAKR